MWSPVNIAQIFIIVVGDGEIFQYYILYFGNGASGCRALQN